MAPPPNHIARGVIASWAALVGQFSRRSRRRCVHSVLSLARSLSYHHLAAIGLAWLSSQPPSEPSASPVASTKAEVCWSAALYLRKVAQRSDWLDTSLVASGCSVCRSVSHSHWLCNCLCMYCLWLRLCSRLLNNCLPSWSLLVVDHRAPIWHSSLSLPPVQPFRLTLPSTHSSPPPPPIKPSFLNYLKHGLQRWRVRLLV